MMQFQEFKIDNLETFPKELESLLATQLETIESLSKNDDFSYAGVIKPMQDLDEELGNFFTPLSHLNSVENSEATQKAYEACLPQLSAFSSAVSQNEALYEKLKKIESTDAEEKRVAQTPFKKSILLPDVCLQYYVVFFINSSTLG